MTLNRAGTDLSQHSLSAREWSTVRLTKTAWGSLDELNQSDPSGFEAVAQALVAFDAGQTVEHQHQKVKIQGLSQTVYAVGSYRIYTSTEIEPGIVLVLGILDVSGHAW